MRHRCIKCKDEYEDEDIEDYLCLRCLSEKSVIATEVDKKVGSTAGQKPAGELKAYDTALKKSGGMFPNAKDLGL